MQDIHAIILTGDNHKKLWNQIVYDTLQKIVPPEPFKRTEVKLQTFSKAYGTILLLRDLDAVEQMKKTMPPMPTRWMAGRGRTWGLP